MVMCQVSIIKHFCKRVVAGSAGEFSVNKIYNEFLKVAKTGILPDGDHINEPTRLWFEKISEELKSWIAMEKNII